MTSKEIVEHRIKMLKKGLILDNSFKDYTGLQIKDYMQVLKDLEDYEELKSLIGTPIQDIMKRLKILDILKNRSYILWVENGELYSGRDGDIQVPLDKEDFESEEDYKLIKKYFEKEEKI